MLRGKFFKSWTSRADFSHSNGRASPNTCRSDSFFAPEGSTPLPRAHVQPWDGLGVFFKEKAVITQTIQGRPWKAWLPIGSPGRYPAFGIKGKLRETDHFRDPYFENSRGLKTPRASAAQLPFPLGQPPRRGSCAEWLPTVSLSSRMGDGVREWALVGAKPSLEQMGLAS